MGPSKNTKQKQQKERGVNNGNNTNDNSNGQIHNSISSLTDAIRQTNELLYPQNVDLNRPNQYEMQNTQSMDQYQGQGQGQIYCAGYNTPTAYQNLQTSSAPVQVKQSSAFYHGPPHPAPVGAQCTQDNGIPPWAANLCQQMLNIQSTLNGHTEKWRSVESKIENQNQDLLRMQAQLSEITKIKQNLESTNTNMKTIQNDVHRIQTEVKNCEQSLRQYSDIYDDLVTNNGDVEDRLKEMEARMKVFECKQDEVQRRLDDTNDRVTDVQWRGMRENLLFCGIQEAENFKTERENCEEIVKKFIREELQIEEDIPLDRCHRLGRFNRNNLRPRPIVAKFTHYKDKESVKRTGQQKLKESAFWVKDQYPKEIEEKRRLLYPVADEARKNESNRVTLVRDKLYINGNLYRPSEQSQQHELTRGNYGRNDTASASAPRTRHRRGTTQWGRTFYRRTANGQQLNDLRQQPSAVPLNNRFVSLNAGTPATSRKNKASSSPLEGDIILKKHCDHTGEESDTESEQSSIVIEADVHMPDSKSNTQEADDTFAAEQGVIGSRDQADVTDRARDQSIDTPSSREQTAQPSRDNADDGPHAINEA